MSVCVCVCVCVCDVYLCYGVCIFAITLSSLNKKVISQFDFGIKYDVFCVIIVLHLNSFMTSFQISLIFSS